MNRINPEAIVALEVTAEAAEAGVMNDLMTLSKARLSLLVIMTTFAGFCMASSGLLDWVALLNVTLGTALAAAAAAVLNQYMESHVDRLMERTKNRPLPAGRMKPSTALVIGVSLAVVGVTWLALTANLLSASLAAATVAIYLFLYTPLKRRTHLCTLLGAVSGAIPPMIGWTAARPSLDLGAWVLFGILFTWQMPHFLAIAWMHRDEYAQAGFVMLRRTDLGGCATAMESFLFTIALTAVTLIPFFNGLNNAIYLVGAGLLDGAMLFFAVRFLVLRNRPSARALFFTSIIFLPLVLGLMVFTKA